MIKICVAIFLCILMLSVFVFDVVNTFFQKVK